MKCRKHPDEKLVPVYDGDVLLYWSCRECLKMNPIRIPLIIDRCQPMTAITLCETCGGMLRWFYSGGFFYHADNELPPTVNVFSLKKCPDTLHVKEVVELKRIWNLGLHKDGG